jgi:galactose-1-phosphate uridylyltransferase
VPQKTRQATIMNFFKKNCWNLSYSQVFVYYFEVCIHLCSLHWSVWMSNLLMFENKMLSKTVIKSLSFEMLCCLNEDFA